LRPLEEPDNRPEAIFLGNLSDIATKSYCPFCRLVKQCAIEEYGEFLSSDLRLRETDGELRCHLDAFTADWNTTDLEHPLGAGPSAWYLGLLVGDLRSSVSTWPRYLVLDAKDSSVVDPMWSYKPFQKRENDSDSDSDSDSEENTMSAGVAELEGQEKVYFYFDLLLDAALCEGTFRLRKHLC
jgi:hypothetical protein